MWESRRLTTIWASTACYRDSFTINFLRDINKIPYSATIITISLRFLIMLVFNNESEKDISTFDVLS
jgi:hypothetical protein